MELTAEIARSIWAYDPQSGHFYWLRSGHGVVRGQRAGAISGNGYLRLAVRGKSYIASRVAWLVVHGKWPENWIDHINGDPSDNRICNLREADPAENNWNRRVQTSSKLGVKGVWETPCGYQSKIRHRGKRYNLGRFLTIEAAKTAYDAAAEKFHGEFART